MMVGDGSWWFIEVATLKIIFATDDLGHTHCVLALVPNSSANLQGIGSFNLIDCLNGFAKSKVLTAEVDGISRLLVGDHPLVSINH